MIYITAAIIFGLCFIGMAVGLMLRGKVMSGGCGNHHPEGNVIACDTCTKKDLNMCKENDDLGLADISNTSTFGRFTVSK